MTRPLDDDDRRFLDRNFARFGAAWGAGLASLERDFEVSVTKRWRSFELALVTRGPERVTFRKTVHRKHGGMHGGAPELPDAPELRDDELAQVDAALRRAEELWLIGPSNDELIVTSLAGGLEALRGARTLETRRIDGTAVLYFRDGCGPLFCLAIELASSEPTSARWVDLPTNPSRRLEPATIDFLDRALRDHGDFGVYGNVTEGLRALARVENFELQLHDDDHAFRLRLTPRDGHGHFLHFAVAKGTGVIGECIAGHLQRSPPIR
jgi:hypothetical protein